MHDTALAGHVPARLTIVFHAFSEPLQIDSRIASIHSNSGIQRIRGEPRRSDIAGSLRDGSKIPGCSFHS